MLTTSSARPASTTRRGPATTVGGLWPKREFYEIGRQCDQYLDVLFRFNRNQRAIRQGLTATGAATASILGVAGVVAMPIAITAVAFGLAASLYDAGVNSVLFTIEPSALRNVVLKGRQAYIRKLDLSKVNSRPRLLIALQGYLTQCSPATIEANVNNAASGAESVVNVRQGVSADGAILGAPGVTLIERATPPATSTAIPTAIPTAMPTQVAAMVVEHRVEATPLAGGRQSRTQPKMPREVAVTKRTLIGAQTRWASWPTATSACRAKAKPGSPSGNSNSAGTA